MSAQKTEVKNRASSIKYHRINNERNRENKMRIKKRENKMESLACFSIVKRTTLLRDAPEHFYWMHFSISQTCELSLTPLSDPPVPSFSAVDFANEQLRWNVLKRRCFKAKGSAHLSRWFTRSTAERGGTSGSDRERWDRWVGQRESDRWSFAVNLAPKNLNSNRHLTFQNVKSNWKGT